MALTMFELSPAEAIEAFRSHLDGGFAHQPSDFHLDAGGSFLNAIGDHGVSEAIMILSLALASGIHEAAEEGLLGFESDVEAELDASFQESLDWVTETLRHNYEHKFKPYLRDIALQTVDGGQESDQI